MQPSAGLVGELLQCNSASYFPSTNRSVRPTPHVQAIAAGLLDCSNPLHHWHLPNPQVPTHIYDRSTSIFVTALAIDILNVVFERQTIKIDCVLLPA